MNKIILSDIAESQTGPFGTQLHESDYVETGTPIVTVEHLGVISFSTQKLPLVSDFDKARLLKYVLKEGDIVFSRVGSVDRSTYVSHKEDGWLFSGRCLRVRVDKNKACPKFISHYFRQKNFKEMMVNISVGATMPSLNTTLMDNLPLHVPDVRTQEKIAAVLSSLDSKIELNNRINAELEAMAKTIYDYWFVQFDFPDKNGKPYKSNGGKMVWNAELKREIPEGWEVQKLSHFGEFRNGINYDPSLPGDTEAKIINVRNISCSTLFVSQYGLDTISLKKKNVDNYLVTDKDIIIARSGIPGATRMMLEFAENTIYCGFIIRFQVNSIINKNYLFYFLKDMERNTTAKSGGTIMSNVNQDTLNRMSVIEPSKHLIIKFNEFITPIFSKINAIIQENQQLSNLRDWLLPMLMNGQVTVNDKAVQG